MFTCTYSGFATHNTCTHMQAQETHKKHTHTHSRIQMYVFKSYATGHFESPLRGGNKSRATEHPNLHYAGFHKIIKARFASF